MPRAVSMPAVVRIATRRSRLALAQATEVVELVKTAAPGTTVELVEVTTRGDREADAPIDALAGQGIFVKEVQSAVLDGRADAAVHSAKDLPSSPALGTAGLVLAAVPARGEVRDALVGAVLEDLRPGAPVATGAPRRRAQLAWLRPDLTFWDLRGNVETRLGKIPPEGAVVVALAALDRLGLARRASEVLAPSTLLPQAGQGALAVECREDDGAMQALFAAVEDAASRAAVDCERAFLAVLGGGCDQAVGAWARIAPGGHLVIDGLLASPDGRVLIRRRAEGVDPVDLGESLAGEILDACGGRALLGEPLAPPGSAPASPPGSAPASPPGSAPASPPASAPAGTR